MSPALVETFKMIKIEHSIFALPFALVSAFLAAGGMPGPRVLGLIVLAMVFARSAAMAFNRYIDAEIDAKNPRTALRSIPAGRLSRNFALGFTIFNALLFMAVAWFLNPLSFYLAPFLLLVLLGYSLTKRFTSLCHLVLGLALGSAPLGAWVAVRGELHWPPLLLGLAVLAWTAGFDVIYACQDVEFDRKEKLFSIPSAMGIDGALGLARGLHLLMAATLVTLGLHQGLGALYWVGLLLVAACLFYEHSLVWGGRLERVNMAFFTMNGVVSLLFGAFTIGSILRATG